MSFLKLIFYVILFVLIKIGDAVYAALEFFYKILSYPFRKIFHLISKVFKSAKPVGFKKTKPILKDRNIISQKTSTSVTKSIFLIKFLSQGLLILSHFFKKIFFLALGFIKKIIRLFGFVFLTFWNSLKFIFRLFTKRKRGRVKKVVIIKTKTSFFYKAKYTIFGAIIALVFFFIPAIFFIFISDLPKLSNLSIATIPKTTKILDRNGNLLFEIYASQNRSIVPLSKVPMYLREATVAIEDKDFYHHSGFDIRGIARAFYVDLTEKQLQGGSTITQQLIKSALLTPEPTIMRKTRELVLAFWAEKKYTKDQILELYFNYVPYGGTAWGIGSASQIYFGQDVSTLDLAQSAYLAGLPQAPSLYSPFVGDGKEGKMRQKEVLSAMVREKYISQKQANDAYKEVLVFASPKVPIIAPHFVMYIKDLLVKKYGLIEVERGGLQVTTSLDQNIQKIAQDAVSTEVDKASYLGVGNGAALVTNPQNGDILAMVGSRDYFDTTHDGNVNLTTSLRQPGSTIKLVTYTLALTRGFTEASIINDTPLSIPMAGEAPYTPVNYDGVFHGPVPLRIAFANSFNIPAVRVAQQLGVSNIVNFGKKMGISSWKSPNNYGLSITLGAAEVSMLDLATIYGVPADNGQRVDLNPILEVKDSEGKVLEKKTVTPVQVVDPGIAFIISNILADNKARSIEFGENSPLEIDNKYVSVKTGTTDEKRDNWTIGYTPKYVVATWVGNNDNTPLSQALASGITGAAPIWHDIMGSLLSNETPTQPPLPYDVMSKKCFGYNAYFIIGTESKASCNFVKSTPTTQTQ